MKPEPWLPLIWNDIHNGALLTAYVMRHPKVTRIRRGVANTFFDGDFDNGRRMSWQAIATHGRLDEIAIRCILLELAYGPDES